MRPLLMAKAALGLAIMPNLNWEGSAGARMNEFAISRPKAHSEDYLDPRFGVVAKYPW